MPSPQAVAIASLSAVAALVLGFAIFKRLSPRHIHYL